MMHEYSWSDPPGRTAFPIARPGYPFIAAAAFATAIFALIGCLWAALIGLVATLAICLFFRDPDRVIPSVPGAVVSPADGTVLHVRKERDTPYYPGECLKIAIFMSVFNVHVNRIPHEGTVRKVAYYPGRFSFANIDKASETNERNAVWIDMGNGREMCTVQVAGWVARRIVCGVQAGDRLKRGQRFGMICFGSRLDVYLPPGMKPDVKAGDKVRTGTSILGCFHETN